MIKAARRHGFLYHGGHGPTRQCISHLPAFSGNVFAVPPGHLPSRACAPPSTHRTLPGHPTWCYYRVTTRCRVTAGCLRRERRDAVVIPVKDFDKTPHRSQKFCAGVSIVITRCRLLCHDRDWGTEFFGDDLASYQNSSISLHFATYFISPKRVMLYTDFKFGG